MPPTLQGAGFNRWARHQQWLASMFVHLEGGQAFFQVIETVNAPVPLSPVKKHCAGIVFQLCQTCVACCQPCRQRAVIDRAQRTGQGIQRRLVRAPQGISHGRCMLHKACAVEAGKDRCRLRHPGAIRRRVVLRADARKVQTIFRRDNSGVVPRQAQ